MEIIKRNLQLNKIIIESRSSDNFINATQLCKAGKKEFKHWFELISTKDLINELENVIKNETITSNQFQNNSISRTGIITTTGISNEMQNNSELTEDKDITLVDIKRGGAHQGSWIHPDLAVPLAQWVSPKFAIQVSRWVRELVVTGNASIDSKKINQELVELTKQLQTEKSKNLSLVTSIYNDKIHKIDGFIYLVTSDQYMQGNNYKLGRCGDNTKRLAPYQVGRPDADLMYYVFMYETEDVVFLEKVIQHLLEEYRQNKSKDIYVLPWPVISRFMQYICDAFHNGIIPEKNILINTNLNFDDQNLSSIIPEPLKTKEPKPKPKPKEMKAIKPNLQCPKCNKVLNNLFNLTRHLNKVVPCDAPLKCTKCSKTFQYESKLKTHLARLTSCV